MSQTQIQDLPAIRKGSVRVQIGNDLNTLVDVGALRNAVVNSLVENQSIDFDNVPSLKKFVKGDDIQITFDLAEINMTNIAMLDAGLVTQTLVAGSATPVTGEAKGTGWTVGKPIKLNFKNGANTVVASIVVKAAGTPLTLNTNYVTYVGDGTNGELGATYIVPVTASAAVITADYTYTPNQSKKLTFTNNGTKALKAMRITNTDANGKVLKVDIINGTNMAPISFDFAGDQEEDVAIMAIDFQGTVVEYLDEQELG